jgi:hypothetical protein
MKNRMIIYKGYGIERLFPSGYYEFYSRLEGQFYISDNLQYVKNYIKSEIEAIRRAKTFRRTR